MKNLLIFFFFFASLYGEDTKKQRVDLASYCYKLLPIEQLAARYPEICPIDAYPMQFKRIREDYDLIASYGIYEYVKNFAGDDADLRKIIFFDYCLDPQIYALPSSKMVLFKWEAIKIASYLYDPYALVYTIDDDLVDGQKFFKFYYPALLPMLDDRPSFQDKKLCTMIVSNWTAERIAIVDFFEMKPAGEFEFYGHPTEKIIASKLYNGPIPGYYSGTEKLARLKNYRFCLCFENTHTTKGYITEKIFGCFAAGCVPIYWGPENIEMYIPKNCFIDYRDFQSNEELYQYIKALPQSTYDDYIENIRLFLQSEAAQVFSPEYFDKILYQAASR